jgi:hypothetical protein
VLPRSPENPLHSHPVETSILDVEQPEYDEQTVTDTQYVLDGPQRITSIARAFLNAHPQKAYYFDLKSLYKDFTSEENFDWIVSKRKGEPILIAKTGIAS